jgi:periplasmic glucans biosynthesis protein
MVFLFLLTGASELPEGRSAADALAGRQRGVFNFEQVAGIARDLAQEEFHDVSESAIPEFLRTMGYDQWRDIRCKAACALWAKDRTKFTIQYFHPGFLFNKPVTINVVDGRAVRRVAFSPRLFDYGLTGFGEKVPKEGLGFGGFRVHYPINTPQYNDEFLVFLGASYFRVTGANEQYGLSARGIAVNTAMPGGEEFPFFKEFWIVKPGSKDRHLVIYALLDSPSLTGAYEFTITPGAETVIDVNVVLCLRRAVEKMGIAPLTSMFLHGEHKSGRAINDFRPEVHDSDGVSIAQLSGEWIWRPVINPHQLFINVFPVGGLQGFGMLQRDTDFKSYEDLESRFERRPSLWITPKGNWGAGRVEIVQIPTPNEYNDNIVAFWVPGQETKPGESQSFSYTMKWGDARAFAPPVGYVTATRFLQEYDDLVKFVIDFEGGELVSLADGEKVDADVFVPEEYEVRDVRVHKNSVTGGWRLVFFLKSLEKPGPFGRMLPERKSAVELKGYLKLGDRIITEVWSYALEL